MKSGKGRALVPQLKLQLAIADMWQHTVAGNERETISMSIAAAKIAVVRAADGQCARLAAQEATDHSE